MFYTRLNPGFALVCLAIFLTGCASATYSKTSMRPSVKPGSYVQLHHEYQVPGDFARVYFRNGKQTPKANVDRFTPYCYISVKDVSQAGQPQQVIYPGRFYVTKVMESNEHFGGIITYVASAAWLFDGPSNVDYKLEMRLSSTEQPGVHALICIKNINDYRDHMHEPSHYPKLSEIKTALGNLVTIEAPEQ